MPAGPTWKFAPEPTSEKNVRHAERALGVTFPADYRECARANGGGAPEPSGFTFADPHGQHVESRVSLLLSLDPIEEENVVGTAQMLLAEGRLPEGLVPIIDDGGGNFVCLDYRHDPPKVAHLAIGGEVAPVADSFAEFLAKLA